MSSSDDWYKGISNKVPATSRHANTANSTTPKQVSSGGGRFGVSPIAVLNAAWNATVERIQAEISNMHSLYSRLVSSRTQEMTVLHKECICLKQDRDWARRRAKYLTEENRGLRRSSEWYEEQLVDAWDERTAFLEDCIDLKERNWFLQYENEELRSTRYSIKRKYARSRWKCDVCASAEPTLLDEELHPPLIKSQSLLWTLITTEDRRPSPIPITLPQLPPLTVEDPQLHDVVSAVYPSPVSPPSTVSMNSSPSKRNRELVEGDTQEEAEASLQKRPRLERSPSFSRSSLWSATSQYGGSEPESVSSSHLGFTGTSGDESSTTRSSKTCVASDPGDFLMDDELSDEVFKIRRFMDLGHDYDSRADYDSDSDSDEVYKYLVGERIGTCCESEVFS